MTLEEFEELSAEIAELNGVDPDTAAEWLAIVGDCPEYIEGSADTIELPDGSGRRVRWVI